MTALLKKGKKIAKNRILRKELFSQILRSFTYNCKLKLKFLCGIEAWLNDSHEMLKFGKLQERETGFYSIDTQQSHYFSMAYLNSNFTRLESGNVEWRRNVVLKE